MATYEVTMDDGKTYDVEMDESAPAQSAQVPHFSNISAGDVASKAGQGALETLYSPFQAVGEAVRGAGEGEPLKVATADSPTGFRAPSILQRLMPSLQTPQPPADPFQKAYQGLEGIANLPRGLTAASDVVTGQPDLAAQLGGLALAMGTGEAGNLPAAAAGKAIGKTVGAILPDLSESQAGQRIASKVTEGAFNLNPLKATKLASKAGVTPEQYVMDLTRKANDLIPDLIEVKDTPNTKFGKILNAHDDAANTIGQEVDAITQQTGKTLPEGKQIIDALRNKASNYYKIDGGEQALTKTADRLEALQKSGELDFDRISQVKSAIGTGFGKANTPPGTTDTYDILNKGLDKAVQRVSSDNPNLAPAFENAKQTYAVTSRLLPLMSKAAGKEVGGGLAGGMAGNVLSGAIGGAIGGLPGAVVGGAGKFVQNAVAPDLLSNLAYLSMKTAPKAAQGVKAASAATNPAVLTNVANLIQQLKAKYDERRKF